mmetsp:Transcript_11395/g.28911  ORF Transcript_11395/g.28911 Transcript_11395/m.28911 type:complete len:228 (-) Transcript_11395:180-863(-)
MSGVLLQGMDSEGCGDGTGTGSEESEALDMLRSSSFSSTSEDPFLQFTTSMMNKHFVLPQIGICHGMPSKVTPHVQTGRADYFGPIVNLTARVAKQTRPGEIFLANEFLAASKEKRGAARAPPAGVADFPPLLSPRNSSEDEAAESNMGGRSTSYFLKGMDCDNEGKWVEADLRDEGKRAFKGVRNKTRVVSVKLKALANGGLSHISSESMSVSVSASASASAAASP